MKKYIFILLAILALSVAGEAYWIMSLNQTIKNKDINMRGLASDLQVARNKDGTQTAKIAALQAEKSKAILELETKDETILELQDVVKRKETINRNLRGIIIYKDSVIVSLTDTTTENEVQGFTQVGDTLYAIYNRPFVLMNPSNDKDTVKWMYGNIRMGKALFDMNIVTKNKFRATIGEERKNIFSPWEPYADIEVLNPFSEVGTLRAYSQSKGKQKKFGLGVHVGYGIMWPDAHGPNISIGLNYNFITF